MLLIPVTFLRTFGVMVGDKKQGWALFVAAAVLFVIGTASIATATSGARGTVAHAVGAPIEGTEIRLWGARQRTFRSCRDGQRRRRGVFVIRQFRKPWRWGADAQHDVR